MIELQAYFTPPLDKTKVETDFLGHLIEKGDQSKTSMEDVNVAIFSISDIRSISNVTEKSKHSANIIRKKINQLVKGQIRCKILDLGELKSGKTVKDTYFALEFVLFTLYKNDIVPIVIGSGDHFIYAFYQFFKRIDQKTNQLHIDYRFDNNKEDLNILTQESFFQKIITDFKGLPEEITVLGTQSYYCDFDPFTHINSTKILHFRLGALRKDLFESESLFRNADFVSIDMNAIRSCDNPANYIGMPNGLYAEEVCQMAWFAGYADRVSLLGLFNYFNEFDQNEISASLIAQIIWHFLDGYSKRLGEHPIRKTNDFVQLHVYVESIRQELLFYQSTLSNRFWLDLTVTNSKEIGKILPVSKQDYLNAVNNQVSDRIYFYLTQG